MKRVIASTLAIVMCITSVPGCAWNGGVGLFHGRNMDDLQAVSTDIEYPDVEAPSNAVTAGTGPPITINDDGPLEYWDLSLDEAIRLTLHNSTVLRDLGGAALLQPDTVKTVYSPALTETDGQFGVDAALSAFDASYSAEFFFEGNDRQLNNQFFGGGVRTLKQDLMQLDMDVTKKSAYGTQYTMRQFIEYDNNNSPGNLFTNGAYSVLMDAEVRHPLLQGGGLDFNRIAGPNGQPGTFNGVLIARIRNDISIAEFEIGVRNLISDVENAYWELYYAYRDLDGRVAARDRSLALWRAVHARAVVGGEGGEAKNEALAREQYYRLSEDVQNSLAGRVIEKSRTTTFRAFGGVQVNERRLRLAMGVPINDGRLIRPANEPATAKVIFDWDQAMVEALTTRAELRRQQWRVKQAELELLASRNFLLPTFDAIGRYRWRGFGHNLLNPNASDVPFDNAYQDLLTGNFQEWQLGFEFTYPIGFRQAHAQIRNAQLKLVREKAVLETQEREIVHDLSTWIAEVERAYVVAQTAFNRRLAAREQLEALDAEYAVTRETNTLDLVLQAQRRMVEAETTFFRVLSEYNLALKQVHFEKGSLLAYNGIQLSEGGWPEQAYHDAQELAHRRVARCRLMSYVFKKTPPVSLGPAPAPGLAPGDHVGLPGVPGLLDQPIGPDGVRLEAEQMIESIEDGIPTFDGEEIEGREMNGPSPDGKGANGQEAAGSREAAFLEETGPLFPPQQRESRTPFVASYPYGSFESSLAPVVELDPQLTVAQRQTQKAKTAGSASRALGDEQTAVAPARPAPLSAPPLPGNSDQPLTYGHVEPSAPLVVEKPSPSSVRTPESNIPSDALRLKAEPLTASPLPSNPGVVPQTVVPQNEATRLPESAGPPTVVPVVDLQPSAGRPFTDQRSAAQPGQGSTATGRKTSDKPPTFSPPRVMPQRPLAPAIEQRPSRPADFAPTPRAFAPPVVIQASGQEPAPVRSSSSPGSAPGGDWRSPTAGESRRMPAAPPIVPRAPVENLAPIVKKSQAMQPAAIETLAPVIDAKTYREQRERARNTAAPRP
ncbi:TolC family protein [Lignipirellula cremea]|uniref:Outer membrane efflux protein n=1 Tax=Lignipirellula cremea TaxID=2528010 RepID=A0A518E0G3_9BACT|nr:TolC family protein [Lignipirellula cremea]QDU97575.1 Outer membrane efflux protein [Lignipirellula cremea]